MSIAVAKGISLSFLHLYLKILQTWLVKIAVAGFNPWKWQIFPNSEWKTHNCWKQTPGCVWHVVSLLLFILFTLGYLDTPRSISSPSLIADEHRHIYIYILDLHQATKNPWSTTNNHQANSLKTPGKSAVCGSKGSIHQVISLEKPTFQRWHTQRHPQSVWQWQQHK